MVADSEFVTLLRHWNWLAVNEGEWDGSDIESVSINRLLIFAERQERIRKERLVLTSGNLALSWIDELLFIAAEDRQAWLQVMTDWANLEGFTQALRWGRKKFIRQLPQLELPEVDASLIRSEIQGTLWSWLSTGKSQAAEETSDNPFARLEPPKLNQAESQLLPDRRKGRIRQEELSQDARIVHRLAMTYFARQTEVLGLSLEDNRQRYLAAVRETVGEQVKIFEWKVEDWEGRRISLANQPPKGGVWSIEPEFLIAHPLFQEALWELISFDDWKRWRQDRQRRRDAQTMALKEFAVAWVDMRLKLSSAQREQAKAVALAYDTEETRYREKLQEEGRRRLHHLFNPEQNPGEQGLIASIGQQIVRDLDSGYMTPWQRRKAAEIRQGKER